MTAKKFMVGGGSVYHEASSPDSGYDMEMSLLGLKMESEDQENVDEDDDEEDEECEDNFGDVKEISGAKDIKMEHELSDIMTSKQGHRKQDGRSSNGDAGRRKRYTRARSARARSPTQVKSRAPITQTGNEAVEFIANASGVTDDFLILRNSN
jgi:hypothetical protein